MIREDYAMRWIRQLSQALTQVLFRKNSKQYEEALEEIQHTGELFLGIDLHAAHALTGDALYDALRARGARDAPHAALVAALLHQQGACFAEIERADDARASYGLALHLYLDLYAAGHELPSGDLTAHIDALCALLDALALPPDTQRLLFRYLDAKGRYARAEDLLFHLAAIDPTEALFREGLAFFERLLHTSYRYLQAGNLPYDEVREGLAAFRRIAEGEGVARDTETRSPRIPGSSSGRAQSGAGSEEPERRTGG